MRAFVAVSLLLVVAAPAGAQHLGARVQWQPQTASPDPRLEQPVDIEILGRAAVPALELLSEATGVSLTVAPENLDTIGERKLTIISHGLTLKAIMVQLPEVLQECHWDVEGKGSQFVYHLHRNAGADQTAARLREAQDAPLKEARRQRLEEARAALKMSEQELVELEKTDLYLARTVKEARARDRLFATLGLPNHLLRELVASGEARIKYGDVSPAMQAAIVEMTEDIIDWVKGFRPEVSPSEDWREALPDTTVSLYWPSPDTLELGLFAAVWPGEMFWSENYVIPPKRAPAPQTDVSGLMRDANRRGRGMTGRGARVSRMAMAQARSGPLHRLLRATGTASAEDAQRMILQASARHLEEERVTEEARRQREWRVPGDPELSREVTTDDFRFRDMAEFQCWLATETGLSVVSDYFTGTSIYVPLELRGYETVPLWRLLYAEGDQRGFRWSKVDRCLRLHHTKWYERQESEVREAVLFAFLRKWQHGTITLDDVVEFAMATPAATGVRLNVPWELKFGGFFRPGRWVFYRVYDSLAPEQRAAALTPRGVRVSEMNPEIRDLVESMAMDATFVNPHSRRDFASATFHIEEEDRHYEEHGEAWDAHYVRLRLKLPDREDVWTDLMLPRPPIEVTYPPFVHALAQ